MFAVGTPTVLRPGDFLVISTAFRYAAFRYLGYATFRPGDPALFCVLHAGMGFSVSFSAITRATTTGYGAVEHFFLYYFGTHG